MRNTRDYKPLPIGTPRASLHFSELHATTFVDGHLQSRPDGSLLTVWMKGWYAVQLFSGKNGIGRACRLMGFAAFSLDRCLANQVDTCRFLRRLFQEVCVLIAAPLLSQHDRNGSEHYSCNRNSLPWIFEH